MKKLEKGQGTRRYREEHHSYGVFMDLGGVDGLLHITDISWGRITHPEEVLKLTDQKINVAKFLISMMKRNVLPLVETTHPHPWTQLDANLNVGDKVKGKVVVIADYGAFVEIAAGVEGSTYLKCHGHSISQSTWIPQSGWRNRSCYSYPGSRRA